MGGFGCFNLEVSRVSGDMELERLRRRRLAELRKRFAEKEEKAEQEEKIDESSKGELSVDEILRRVLVGRAWEVLAAAEAQYPRVVFEIKKGLALLVREGKIRGTVSGEQLMWLFRRLGLRVRLETRIRISESGELKTLAQKLREE